MTTVCLVRHGETDWNRIGRLQGHEDIELNEAGEKQARQCGIYLARESWDVIITSSLKRARKTAEIIEQHVKPTMLYEIDELRERNYGAASGLTNEEVAARHPDGKVPGREERADLTHRSMHAIDRIIQHHTGQKVIVVSHGAVINAILASLSNGVIGTGKTILENACINRLTYDSGTWEVVVYNSTEHFD